jgi:hypothetical protein
MLWSCAMNHRTMLISCTVLVALLLGWLNWGEQQQPDQNIAVAESAELSSAIENSPAVLANDPQPLSAPIETPVAQASAIVETSAAQLREWDMRVDKAIEILVPMAKAGNVAAQMALSGRLGACTAYSMRKLDERDERSRANLKEYEESSTMEESSRDMQVMNQLMHLESTAKTRAGCAEVSSELISNWLLPLENAANSGDTAAMRRYAEVSVQEYESLEAVVADPETALLRRDKSRAYLFEAIRRGDVHALYDVAFGYAERAELRVSLFSSDTYRFYVYAYARLLSTAPFEIPMHERTLRWLSSEAAATFDAETLARAEAEGRKIFAACCSSSRQ